MPLTGPRKTPHEFGFKAGESHLIANDQTETIKAFEFSGKLLWEVPCLCKGIAGADWTRNSGDTPPGLYLLGALYDDISKLGLNPNYDRTLISYGWITFDMVELENQEAKVQRAGMALHGGGKGCGWPGAWAAKQRLFETLGCTRMYNIDLRDKVLPLYQRGRVFLSVYQD